MTAQTDAENRELVEEMRAIKRQIAELSALLALKKLENDHPALQKIAAELDMVARTAIGGGQRVAGMAEHYWQVARDNEPLVVAAKLAVIAGLACLTGWAWLRSDRRH